MRNRHITFTLAIPILALLSCANPSGPPVAQFGIKDGPTQTVPRRYAVRAERIPINLRYAELSADQRDIIRSWYVSIAPGDEPPFPADGLRPVYEAILQRQNVEGVKGEMLMVATISSTGEVEFVKVYQSPSESMTKFVSAVLVMTKFKPAVCGGAPCQMEYPFSFKFE